MESTEAMRARVMELASPARDDFDRAVLCILRDFDKLASERSRLLNLRRELFDLCEYTEDSCEAIAKGDTEGKQGAFARGRIHEAKGIRRAMGEVFREMLADAAIAKVEGR